MEDIGEVFNHELGITEGTMIVIPLVAVACVTLPKEFHAK
jgi:hypothetical protein